MEPTDRIAETLRRTVADAHPFGQDVATLRERLGCLALNMTAAGQDMPVAEGTAAYWLFHLRWHKLALLPSGSLAEIERAAPIWRRGIAAGVLSVDEHGVGFTTDAWRVAFCVDCVRMRPLEPRLFHLMARPSFRDVWREWARMRPDMVDDVARPLRTATNRAVRFRAATVLSWLNDPRHADLFLAALDDPSAGVRVVAIHALSALGDQRAIPPLLGWLRRPGVRGRRSLTEALVRFGEAAVPGLIALIDDNEPAARAWAMDTLGRLGDPRAIEPLIEVIRGEADGVLRRVAVTTLGRLRGETVAPAVLEAIIAALADPSTRLNAIWALGDTGDARAITPLVAVMRQGASGERRAAAAAIAKIGAPQARDLLLAALTDADPNVRAPAAGALGGVRDPRLVVRLIRALDDADATVRRGVATALSRLGGEAAATALLGALVDEDAGVRDIAARKLEGLGDRRAVEPLIRALGRPDGATVAIVGALARLGDRRAVEPLIRVIGEPRRLPGHDWAAYAAIRALGDLGDDRAVAPLLRVLEEPPADPADVHAAGRYWVHRLAAIEALGKLGDPRAVEPLIATLGTGGGGSQWSWKRSAAVAAAKALVQIADPRALRALAQVQRPRAPDDAYGRALNHVAARGVRDIRERLGERGH